MTAFAVGAVLSAFWAKPLARAIRENPVVVFLWLCSWCLIISFTLTPGSLNMEMDPEVITTRGPWIWSLPNPWALVTSVNWQSMNLLMFLPLGVATGLLRNARSIWCALVIGVATSFAVEVVQYFAVVLGRSQFNFATVIIGWTGIGLGFIICLLISRARRWRIRPSGV